MGEHFLPALIHAKKILLTENATVIPAAATVYAMLMECPKLRRVNPIGSVAGFDLSDFDIFRSKGYKQVGLSNIDYKALGGPIDILRIDFERDTAAVSKKSIEIRIKHKGFCQAVAFWFELYLWNDIKLSTFHDSFTNHWKQAVQFFEEDYPVSKGDIVNLEVVQDSTGIVFNIHEGSRDMSIL